jgi:hypothetical protein
LRRDAALSYGPSVQKPERQSFATINRIAARLTGIDNFPIPFWRAFAAAFSCELILRSNPTLAR